MGNNETILTDKRVTINFLKILQMNLFSFPLNIYIKKKGKKQYPLNIIHLSPSLFLSSPNVHYHLTDLVVSSTDFLVVRVGFGVGGRLMVFDNNNNNNNNN